MSSMDDDLFTYEVEIPRLATIPCDLKDEDDSEQRITHGSDDDREYDPSNVKFTKWLDVMSLDFDDEDEVAKIFRIDTNVCLAKILRDLRLTKIIRMIGFMNGMKICHGCMKNHGRIMKVANLLLEGDRYCNEWNLPGAYIVGNTLRYQDLEWYEALKDGELKEEALKNKAIMEGIIDEDDESSNEG
nr:hypothetical protein [Tanacetum cinerariifolium]